MHQITSSYNSPFKDSHSHRIYTRFAMIASNENLIYNPKNVVMQISVKFEWSDVILRVDVVVKALPCSEAYWTVAWKNNSGTCHCSIIAK